MIWEGRRAANRYVDRQAPWALRKTDPARMAAVLRVLADVLRVIATVLQPFMPEHGGDARPARRAGRRAALADLAMPLPEGTALPAPQGVFPRYRRAGSGRRAPQQGKERGVNRPRKESAEPMLID